MKPRILSPGVMLVIVMALLATFCPAQERTPPGKLKVHAIFASNMAFPLGKVQESDIESAQAHLPLLRFFAIDPNEQSELAEDIPAERIT